MEVEEKKTMRNYIKFPGRKDPLNTQHIEWKKKKIRTKVHNHTFTMIIKFQNI